MNIDQLLEKIYTYILNPFIGFLFVVATILFLYGVARYYLSSNPSDREIAHRHIIWGLIGMFIMISVFGIMRLIVGTFGVNLSEFGTSIPSN
ncbi:MAG: hypothetical protein WC878_02455 [Candidatus Paceibacterota bacterium]|jgi:hypothetical protein